MILLSWNCRVIKKVKADINWLLFQDELFLRQRSRAIWLPAGDKNTKFFHQRASQRCSKNHIASFLDNNGLWSTSEEATARVAENYFKDLFTSSNPRNMGPVLDVVDRVVTPKMNSTLLQPYTEEEVRQALFHMHPSKSPDPDGMFPFFFQKYWHIVGKDVADAVISILSSGRCLKKMNYTHIVLIPKKNDPQLVSNYRPISLNNVVSRIVSKVLANRLKLILPNVISDSQSTFVPNRLITDNTTIAFEVLHRIRNK